MMDGSPDISVGERIRFYRQARRKKQAVVAGLAGITEDYLSQIERGMKTPSITLLHRLARILGVQTAVLLGESKVDSGAAGHPLATDLHRVLTAPAQGAQIIDLRALRERVEAAWSAWQTSRLRYTEISPLLSALIRDTESSVRVFRGGSDAQSRREAFRIAADLYFLLRTFTKRIGRTDLALLVADRGIRAAEDADDPLRIAAATWNLGQVYLALNEWDIAEEVAIKAAEALEPDCDGDPIRDALYGALWLVAVIAAVRNGDAWTARDRLRERARPAAQMAGEGNAFWTVFGPTNVGLHAVNIEVEAGETAEALRFADEVGVSGSPSIERRVTFSLELARCYEQRREDHGVLLHLLAAEHQAPEDVRFNPFARDLVRGLLKRARPTLAPSVRDLAGRIELYPSL